MLKKSFFGLSVPRIEYEVLPVTLPEPDHIRPSNQVVLFHPKADKLNGPALFRPGDDVQAGQKIALFADDPAYVIASETGRISSVSPFTGDYGKSYLAITINIDEKEVTDTQFESVVQNPTLQGVQEYLACVPGKPPLHALSNPDKNIDTIVISGVDSDLLVGTNQYILKNKLDALKSGIKILNSITGIENIILTVAYESMQTYGHLGVQMKAVDTSYPSALPPMVMKDVLGKTVPAGQSCEDLGVCFFSAEAVASIGTAFDTGRIPFNKTITLIRKDGSQKMIEAKIGTPIQDIFDKYGMQVSEKDRVIFGGPMQGLAVYSLEHPVLPDTDAIMLIDYSEAANSTNYPCINCGDCVRTCPANIQVNLLVRFLEAGQYEEAAENHDLYSCVECGLCSFVCVSMIPIYQYIKLAKYELERAQTAEATDA
ncbi:MAG: 4Fe-4S dicluster domain-containing protein [Deltaproteobacteria bacterium]|jgi:electron transport complex protein RnfC|nr:4Fe-4S dicluster domain-containing protein [Deltaproteobacteria bacterium]